MVIQDFKITFNGNSFDEEANTSTFSYTVTRLSSANGFNYMAFEIPDCAAEDFAEYSPLSSSSVTDDEIRWTSSIGSGSSRIHTVTYYGKKTTGMIDATIQGSGADDIETKAIPGPCKGIYTMSGFVYVDENGDGSRSAGEAGIGNVTVRVTDLQSNSSGSEVTSSDGSYTFSVYTGGDERSFKLVVPAETPENTADINELLFSTYNASEGAGGVTVVMESQNVGGRNFGFVPDTGGMIEKFENPDAEGAIILNTKPPEYWEDELFFSTRGRKTDFTKDELLGLLAEIEQLDLTFAFNFGSDKIAAATDILSVKLKGGNQSSALEILKSELLAAKLNVVSGNGAVDGPPGFNADEFNLLILKTGAASVVAMSGSDSGESQMMNSTSYKTTSEINAYTLSSDDDSTSLLLTSFNRSGTGGGGVGGD
ncbi:MAG: SdrD B-like domain-containing protein [Cyclonatronaceae bacterium]